MRSIEILIVDDEPGIRLFLADCLQDEGYAVRTAEHGEQALAQCRVRFPDLMVLDLNMPRMSGFALLAELDRLGWRRFPVLVVTGHRDAPAELAVVADALLQKPLDINDLIRAVQRLLAESANRRRRPN